MPYSINRRTLKFILISQDFEYSKRRKKLTPVFGIKKTCFGILSIIKQALTNVLFADLSSFNNGVLPKRKSLPKKKQKKWFSLFFF